MSQSKHDHSGALKNAAKGLAISLLKTLGVSTAFIFRLTALVLTRLADLIEKLTGHGNSH